LALGAMSIDKEQIRACLFEGCEKIIGRHSAIDFESEEFFKRYLDLKRQSTANLAEIWNQNKKEVIASQNSVLRAINDTSPVPLTPTQANPNENSSQPPLNSAREHPSDPKCKEPTILSARSLTNPNPTTTQTSKQNSIPRDQPFFTTEPPCHSLKIAWCSITRMLDNPNLDTLQNRADSISSNNFCFPEKTTPKTSNFASLIQNNPEKNPKNLQRKSKEDVVLSGRGSRSRGGSLGQLG
jgi:hypothetical protein